MKDKLGQKIELGDLVVFSPHHDDLRVGRIEARDSWRGLNDIRLSIKAVHMARRKLETYMTAELASTVIRVCTIPEPMKRKLDRPLTPMRHLQRGPDA